MALGHAAEIARVLRRGPRGSVDNGNACKRPGLTLCQRFFDFPMEQRPRSVVADTRAFLALTQERSLTGRVRGAPWKRGTPYFRSGDPYKENAQTVLFDPLSQCAWYTNLRLIRHIWWLVVT